MTSYSSDWRPRLGQGSFRGLQAAATGHLQSLGLLYQAVWPIPSSTLQLPWTPGPELRLLIPHSGLWLPSHTEDIMSAGAQTSCLLGENNRKSKG